MNVINLRKQLKKLLRGKRRWLALGTFFLVLSSGFLVYSYSAKETGGLNHPETAAFSAQEPMETTKQKETLEAIARTKNNQEIFVKKTYVCGEELQKLGSMPADEILRIHREHPDWTVNLDEQKHVVFTEQIEDLSPECKQSGYFGVDENGNLSLFHGVPGKDNIIRTFFQLNIGHLESSLPKETVQQLHEGIRVTDLAEFNSVLSTFSDFAVEYTEEVLFPAEFN